jgi:VIT1/CCC1 family predicted Fe2+/Mn2+ transporter
VIGFEPRLIGAVFHFQETKMAGRENHYVSRVGWTRAAVPGANDGIVSTASLILGVAAASTVCCDSILAGAAGLAAGAP